MDQVKKQLKILVFDDDRQIPALLRKFFEFQGHTVETYSDPTYCPLFQTHKNVCNKSSPCFDVLISDINMPHVSGIELIARQKQYGCKIHDQNRALMSSEHYLESEFSQGDLGCKFFRKPFNISEVLGWLEECADRSRAHDDFV